MATAPLSVEPLEAENGQPLLVKLARLPASALPTCMHAILQLVFFAQDEPQFFTVSVTNGSTISLVAQPERLAALAAAMPENTLETDETDWCVVRVDEGSLGFESIGVVERLAAPLASAGIPVLYISTYSTDYCLLPLERLDEALDCLAPSPTRPRPLPHVRGVVAAKGVAAAAAPTPEADLPESSSRHSHALTVLDGASHIVRLEKSHRQRHTGALLRLLFMPQDGDVPPAIASFTETADEISLISSAGATSGGRASWWQQHVTSHHGSEHGLQHDSQEWVPIRVGDADGTPLSEVGVIATQAKILAEADISIFYLSTYENDYTLVSQADIARAAEAFESAGFRLERSHR